MRITCTNQQRRHDAAYRRAACEVFRRVAESCFAANPSWAGRLSGSAEPMVHVVFAGPRTMRRINRETRLVDAATDVLSFPMLDMKDGKPKQRIGPEDLDPSGRPGVSVLFLGDILIDLVRAEKQAREFGHPPEREIAFLAAHATLHLLGYDHDEPLRERRMRRMQRTVLAPLGYRR